MLLTGHAPGWVVSRAAGHRPCAPPRRYLPSSGRDVTARAWEKPWGGSSARQQGLPLSLFHPYMGLPADGMAAPTEEDLCDPQFTGCKTPVQVFEEKCTCCSGTGWARISSRVRKHQRRRPLASCSSCTGLGYVRRTSASFFIQQETIARPAAAPQDSQVDSAAARRAAEAAARAAAEAEAAEKERRWREAQEDEWGADSSPVQSQDKAARVLVAK